MHDEKKQPVALPYRCPRCDRPGDGKITAKGGKDFPCGSTVDARGRIKKVGKACAETPGFVTRREQGE